MIILKGAFKTTTEKVISTIINIILFRITYHVVKSYFKFSGVVGFFITIYFNAKLKSFIVNKFQQFKRAFFPQFVDNFVFDASKLESIEKSDGKEFTDLEKKLKEDANTNLFYAIFDSSTRSALLNLFSIVAVEYLTERYEINIILSIIVCVSIAFVFSFSSCYRYTEIVCEDWEKSTKPEEAKTKRKEFLIAYSEEETQPKEPVVIFITDYENTNTVKVSVKYLDKKFAKNISEIVDFYISQNLPSLAASQIQDTIQDESILSPEFLKKTQSPLKYFTFMLGEYYDVDYKFSKMLKAKGFRMKSSWNEFTMFFCINFKVYEYYKDLTEKPKASTATKKKTN